MADDEDCLTIRLEGGVENGQLQNDNPGIPELNQEVKRHINTVKVQAGVVASEDMSGLSEGLPAKSIDLKNLNISQAICMSSVFGGCSSLKPLDPPSWGASQMTGMPSMFNSCSSLESIIFSDWDVSRASNMYAIFAHCPSLSLLDISNWKASSLNCMAYMLEDWSSLKSLKISGWTGLV